MTGATPEVVVSTMLPAKGPHGSQTHIQMLAEFMAATGRTCSIVTPFLIDQRIVLPVIRCRRLIRPVSRPAAVWWYRRSHSYFLRRALATALAGGRPGVVYAQCTASAEAAMRVRRNQLVVMSVLFHESQADDWAEQKDLQVGDRVYRSIRAFEERVIPRLDGLVYLSDYSREMIERRVPRAAEIPHVVVHNPITIIPRAPAAKVGELITVGTLEPRKNQGYLLEILAAAARRGHRYSLTVVGKGPDRARLEARARQLDVHGQVRFTGFHPDSRALMSQHQVYCHTALMENFGIAPLEAMAEGLPVLAAPVGGLREVVRNGLDGAWWPLGDAEKAAEVLVEFMTDTATRQAASARASTRARRDFSPVDLGNRLIGFLDEIGSRPIRRPTL